MKRNMDLVRQILMILNECERGYAPETLTIDGYSNDEIGYHCLLMNEAGLIEAAKTSHLGSKTPTAKPIRLTWHGHEFIENAQNEKIWAETKQVIAKVGDASFSVWASVLAQVVIQNLSMGG